MLSLVARIRTQFTCLFDEHVFLFRSIASRVKVASLNLAGLALAVPMKYAKADSTAMTAQ